VTSTTSRELGQGVRVMAGDGRGLVVQSSMFDLGWRTRADGVPGSVVMWEGSSFEVVDREPWRRGARWTLEPWTGEDVMRVVAPLDEASVGSAAGAARSTALATRLRPWLWLLSPLLGFAPAAWQRRWRNDWGYPATFATWITGILEVAVGAAGVMEVLSALGAGASLFPWLPRPLVFFALVLFVEGCIRLAQVVSDSEPVGSIVGLVLAVLERRPPPVDDPLPAPSVKLFDERAGELELVTSIHRRDWESPGHLPYRGDLYVLEATTKLGASWVYRFVRADVGDGGPGSVHRLLPPRSKAVGRSFPDRPGIVKTVLLSIACTVAPRRFQERWARVLGVGAFWFTAIGASAELLGGLANLRKGPAGGEVAVLLNVFFVCEATTRFAWLVFKGHPLGSLIGLPLAAFLEHNFPEPEPGSNEAVEE
jgi:hypothetical protein